MSASSDIPTQGAPAPPAGAPTDSGPSSAASHADAGPGAVAAERPEIAVGAAFAGGLVLALILKRLASR